MFNLAVLFSVFVAANAVSLPSYIKQCRKSDPEIDKCALKHGREAIGQIVYGEKSLRLPSLVPLKLPFVQLQNSQSLQLNLTDVHVIGLEKAELMDMHVGIESKEIQVAIHIEDLLLKGQYQIDGRILILPIQGKGPGLMRIHGGEYTYGFRYSLHSRKGEEYGKVEDDKFKFKVKKAEFQLENLFNGEERLGKEMNKFLNENWEDVLQEFEGVIESTISTICKTISHNLFDRVPFNKIFLE